MTSCLTAGETVDAYVINLGYAAAGNTQTEFGITEANPVLDATGCVAFLGIGASLIESLRRRRACAVSAGKI